MLSKNQTQTSPGISDAARAVEKYFEAPKHGGWQEMLTIIECVIPSSHSSITFRRGSEVGLNSGLRRI